MICMFHLLFWCWIFLVANIFAVRIWRMEKESRITFQHFTNLFQCKTHKMTQLCLFPLNQEALGCLANKMSWKVGCTKQMAIIITEHLERFHLECFIRSIWSKLIDSLAIHWQYWPQWPGAFWFPISTQPTLGNSGAKETQQTNTVITKRNERPSNRPTDWLTEWNEIGKLQKYRVRFGFGRNALAADVVRHGRWRHQWTNLRLVCTCHTHFSTSQSYHAPPLHLVFASKPN